MSLSTQVSLARLRARKLSRVLRHPGYRAALRKGVLASTDHADAGLGPHFATVVDVGASRGQFATFARHTWPAARIVCFEPLAEAARRIHEVVPGRVEVHVTAVGSSPGAVDIHVSGHDDSSSLLPIGHQAEVFPGTAATGTREVPVTTLAGHLATAEGPVLLKIDVQGFELEVLRGAGDDLGRVDELLCECSFVELYTGQALAGEVVGFLADRGFDLVHVSGVTTRAGRQLQADLLFRRRADAAGT
ncbi:FkbM family methyltransferase [Pseudonocardia sp. ICBG162]|uniref:FkbM family methyltransferase n=1 Tax=Pseudonocardia sp. ICBG162 TaxID=2846761 RepID=UPI001CF6DA5F|nr:FkbM family methyltransferase [Pseudonocardia sp. ICBG162]